MWWEEGKVDNAVWWEEAGVGWQCRVVRVDDNRRVIATYIAK